METQRGILMALGKEKLDAQVRFRQINISFQVVPCRNGLCWYYIINPFHPTGPS